MPNKKLRGIVAELKGGWRERKEVKAETLVGRSSFLDGTETVCRADGWRAADLGARSIFSPGEIDKAL